MNTPTRWAVAVVRLLTVIVLAEAMLLGRGQAAETGETARITVQTDRLGATVSPTLYGLFFEEINHAGDGGLYAEMLQNRSFEETVPIEGCTLDGNVCRAPALPSYITGQTRNWRASWQFSSPWPAWTLETEKAEASMTLETCEPVHPCNVRYLRLGVASLVPGGSVRLINQGYWGVAVKQGEPYEFSCYARAQGGFQGAIEVGLIGQDGRLLAAETIRGIGPGAWTKHATSLVAAGTDTKARFFLRPLSTGTVDLDVVSLFPRHTFKGRANGCRADLAQKLADLKPAFLRFPGGCVVEGATMANRYRWKETIGDVVARPGHWSLWNYRTTDGLGYFEFLQLCEDLGCGGMYVCNCGMACEYRNGDFWPDERLDESIQDTLDAVEYALGDTNTKWGALRARHGHPAPFPLKYVEIGNENHGPIYEARYERFAAALQKAWPQVTLICNTGFPKAEIHDQHFYVAPEFFLENFHLYDKRPGPGEPPKVYVGEYAVNRNVGAGNLRAALAEAVFMMGMERNSDYVVMASYAPLFFHVNDRKWPVNLIGFDSATSFGRTSYYVQKMFADHQPDVNLACQSTSPSLEAPPQAGAIGVGTWGTQAEFKDVRVIREGQTLLSSDFSSGLKGWKTTAGEWTAVDGALRQSSSDRPARATAGDKSWQDYTLSLKARKLGGAEGFLISFQTTHDNEKCWWNLGGWGNRAHGLEVPGVAAPHVPGKIEIDRWYDIRVELQGSRIRCYLDGRLIHDVSRSTLPSLFALAGQKNATGEMILKVVNASSQPQVAQVSLTGVRSVASQARVVVLAHDDATAENSLAEPRKIVPVEQTRALPGPEFSHTFPAHSLTVFRIGSGK